MIKKIIIVTALSLLTLSATAKAQDEDLVRRWSFGLRLGGFSTSNDNCWYRGSPRAQAGFEFTNFISSRSAISLTFDAMGYAGGYVGIVPITVTYKLFPAGNGTTGGKLPALQPWIGGGVGLYIFGPGAGSVANFNGGAHAACGVIVPIVRYFEVNGELRYSATNRIRTTSFVLGFSLRF